MIEYYKKNCSTELVNYSDAGSTVDYKSILNAITEGIYAIDEHGSCVYCTCACWRILGYNASEDILGKNMQ